jgi:hypothetical protein
MRSPSLVTNAIRHYTNSAMPKAGSQTTKLAMLYQVSDPHSILDFLHFPYRTSPSGYCTPFLRGRSQASKGKWLPGLVRRHRGRDQQDHQFESSQRQHRGRTTEAYKRQPPFRDRRRRMEL